MLKFMCCHLQSRNIYPVFSENGVGSIKTFYCKYYLINMSNSHLYLQAGYPRAVLANGIGRVICQLQRITIKFCKSHGGSRGVREFIENDLLDFAKSNPNIVIYLKPRRHRSPVFVAEYLNNERKWLSVHCFTRAEVNGWLNLLKTQSGIPEMRFMKPWHTDNPSIQGPWNPFLFKNPDFNIAKFPDDKFSLPKNLTPTATEILLEMAKNQKITENNETDSAEKKLEEKKLSNSKIELRI